MQFNLKLQNDFKNNIRREWALTNGLGGYCRRFSHRCDKPYASGLSDCKPSCSCAKIRLLLKDKRKNSHRQPHLRPLK